MMACLRAFGRHPLHSSPPPIYRRFLLFCVCTRSCNAAPLVAHPGRLRDWIWLFCLTLSPLYRIPPCLLPPSSPLSLRTRVTRHSFPPPPSPPPPLPSRRRFTRGGALGGARRTSGALMLLRVQWRGLAQRAWPAVAFKVCPLRASAPCAAPRRSSALPGCARRALAVRVLACVGL